LNKKEISLTSKFELNKVVLIYILIHFNRPIDNFSFIRFDLMQSINY